MSLPFRSHSSWIFDFRNSAIEQMVPICFGWAFLQPLNGSRGMFESLRLQCEKVRLVQELGRRESSEQVELEMRKGEFERLRGKGQ